MRIRVQGIPYRDDVAYHRFGYDIPCAESVELEVDAETYAALVNEAWLRVDIIDDSSGSHEAPPTGGTAHSDTADAADGGAASASLEADGTAEPSRRALRQRGRNRR